MKKMTLLILFAFCLSFFPMAGLAQDNLESQAKTVTALFRALRATVASNPKAIHETDNFFKDTDATTERLLKQAGSFYQALSKRKLDDDLNAAGSGMLKNLIAAYRIVIKEIAEKKLSLQWQGENDYVKKWDGKLLPARFAGLLATRFNEMESTATIKLTTSKQLLVNTNNAPDDWESQVIEEQMVMSNKVTGKPASQDSGSQFRYILPEYYLPACIQCHGTAKGQEGPNIHPNPELQRGVGSFAGGISLVLQK